MIRIEFCNNLSISEVRKHFRKRSETKGSKVLIETIHTNVTDFAPLWENISLRNFDDEKKKGWVFLVCLHNDDKFEIKKIH
jgi:hypothetical protein